MPGHIENRKSKSKMANQNRSFADDAFCPHLGSSPDPASRYMFPNKLHICLKAKPRRKIALDYQENHCLTLQHKTCSLYKSEFRTPLPTHLRREETVPILQKKPKRPFMLLIVAILAIGGTLGLMIFRKGEQATQPAALPAASSATMTPTEVTKTPIPSPTQTETSLPTKTLTLTPTATTTAVLSPTPGPALGTPFGNYLLHQVQPGESLAMIAIQYKTTVEQIEAINILREGRSVWADDILVIPIGAETEREVRFQYVLIEEASLLSDLAEDYAIAIEDLREYNQLGLLDWVPTGRWLIIPVASE